MNFKRATEAGVRQSHGTESDIKMVVVNSMACVGPNTRGPPLFSKLSISRRSRKRLPVSASAATETEEPWLIIPPRGRARWLSRW